MLLFGSILFGLLKISKPEFKILLKHIVDFARVNVETLKVCISVADQNACPLIVRVKFAWNLQFQSLDLTLYLADLLDDLHAKASELGESIYGSLYYLAWHFFRQSWHTHAWILLLF